jgi:hypothetical protein
MTVPHLSLYNSVRIVARPHVRRNWNSSSIPGVPKGCGDHTISYAVGTEEQSVLCSAEVKNAWRFTSTPWLCTLLRIRLRCVVLNLELGTSPPPPIFFTLRFCCDVLKKELIGEDFETLNYFTIFNKVLYTHTHTRIYILF